MDNIKKYVTKIIREAMSADSPIKEVSSYKGIDGYFDTALQWIWLFGGKELLKNKLEIYSPSNEFRTFKKAMETGKITIQDLDKVTKGEHGQVDNIAFSQTAVWKQDLKPYLDNYNQEKFNNLNIDLEEESATGAIGVGAGPINTPYAFAKKGQKTNKATQTAMKQGFKKAPGMPKNSKMFDYKEMWPGKKSSMNESLVDIIKEELLNEVTYSKFKNDVKLRTKNEQLHKAIKEVKRKLAEIDLIVEYTSRMKQELSEGEEGIKYWKNTQKNMATISEMVTNLNDKIKSLQE
jgi:hypothetical protein